MKKTMKALFTGMMAIIMLLEPATMRVYALDEISVTESVVTDDDLDGVTLSDNQMEEPEDISGVNETTEDILSENSISENSVSENSVSENEVLPEEIDIPVDDISVDITDLTVSENSIVSENEISDENTLSENEVETVPIVDVIDEELSCDRLSASADKSITDSDYSSIKGTPILPQIVATPSSDEKSVDITISVKVGYICYTTNGKKPGYKFGFPERGTTCVRDINCSFKLKGETSYTIQAMNVTPDGKASGISKTVVKLDPKLSKLKVDGPTRVVPGNTASYTVSTTPAGKKLKNVVWSLDFPNGSMIEEFVSINEKSGKAKIIKNNITTSAVTLCNNPIFYVYATAVEGSTVIKSDKYSGLNIIKEVLDENINVIPLFKRTKYFNNNINELMKKYNNNKNINIKSNNYNDINKSLNINNLKEKNNFINNNLNIFQKENLKKKKKNNIISKDYLSKNSNNNQNNNINSEGYLFQNSSEKKNKHYANINVQNIIFKLDNNLNEISSRINPSNDLYNKNLLLNINSNINVNNNKIQFIGNKRNLDNLNIEKTEKEIIYDEIKKLFNNNKNNSIEFENKILENQSGFFNKNETIIMNNNAFCIIYLDRTIINSIYLINEETKIYDDNGIIEILNKIKNDMKNKIKN